MIIHVYDTFEVPKIGSPIITDCGKENIFVTIESTQFPKEESLCDKCVSRHRNIGNDLSIQTFMVVDDNFFCRRCDGILMEVRKNSENRAVFNCQSCHENEILECTVCHMPREIWSDDGDVCGLCALEAIHGRRGLTKAQWKGMAKWAIKITSW